MHFMMVLELVDTERTSDTPVYKRANEHVARPAYSEGSSIQRHKYYVKSTIFGLEQLRSGPESLYDTVVS